MKRIALVVCLFGTLAAASGARADTIDVSGYAIAPNPASHDLGGGASQSAGAALCDPSAQTNGLDGYWIDLAQFENVQTGDPAVLTPDSQSITDFDVYFYDETCSRIGYLDMAKTGMAQAESGAVPAGARYVVASLVTGAQSTFTLTITTAEEA